MKMDKDILRGGVTAVRTLTALPVPGQDARNIGSVLVWFPLIGAGMGVLAVVLNAVLPKIFSDLPFHVNAFAILLFLVLITRAFHLDGLADWADAFWGGYDRERTLSIMKDSNIGTFGAVALIIVLLGKWIGITGCLHLWKAELLIPILAFSRTGQVTMSAFSSYARREGGTGGLFINEAKPIHAAGTLGITLVISFLVVNTITVVSAFILWLAVVILFTGWCRQRVGGMTGDLLGAGSELMELLMLLVLPAI